MAEPDLPSRVHDLAGARRRFGDLPDRLIPFLARTDPRADAVVADFAELPPGAGARCLDRAIADGLRAPPDAPASLRALIERATEVPVWVDWARAEAGGRLLDRAGALGVIALSAKSLVLGYCSPAGNKPLVMAGRLEGDVGRRLAETGRYIVDVCAPDGLRVRGRRVGDGLATSLRVRLMHAQVRRLLVRSGRWDAGRWGAPLNQHDMVGTQLMFALVFLDGVRELGLSVSRAEAEDWMHLWRVAGWLMGVDEALLPATEAEGRRIAEALMAMQGAPDDDSRALVRALIESPADLAGEGIAGLWYRAQVRLGWGYARALVPDELADALEIPRDATRFVAPLTRGIVRPVEALRRVVPGGEAAIAAVGRAYWRAVLDERLRGSRARFALPVRLGTRRAAAR